LWTHKQFQLVHISHDLLLETGFTSYVLISAKKRAKGSSTHPLTEEPTTGKQETGWLAIKKKGPKPLLLNDFSVARRHHCPVSLSLTGEGIL